MKKLLVISSYPAPYRIAVFEGLREKYQMDVFFSTCNDQNRNSSFFVNREESRFFILSEKEDRKKYKEALRNIKQYSAVLAYDWYLPAALVGELYAMVHHIPYFINCDGALPENKKGVKELIKKFFVKHAKCCFAGGTHAREYFLKYGAKEENIADHRFTSLKKEMILLEPVSQSEKEKLRKELCLKNRKIVLTIGQFIERKGFDVLLEAWSDLDDEYQLLIVGGGELKESYMRLIHEKKYENVHLLDFVPFKEIHQYYEAADLFVLPTREDIWGLVINEAMAYGLPVISTDRCVAGLELIEEGVNGAIVPVGDSISLHHQMKHYLDSSILCYQAGVESLLRIQQYTLENTVKSHLEAFTKLF